MSTTMEAPAKPDPSRSRAPRVLAVAFGTVLLLIGVFALAWGVLRSTDTSTESFAGPVERVVIEVNGRVTVEPGDAIAVTVEREWLVTGPPDVDVTHQDGTLRVDATCGFLQWGCQTHVFATAPAGAEVVVATAAGNVTVTGFEGGVDLTSSAGNILVTDVTGPASLRSSAGRIEGDISDGNVAAETSAGRIELSVLGDFDRISAVTSAGSVRLTVPDDVYRVDADTSAGDVITDVATDPDATREIVARSSAGNITIAPAG